MTRRVAVTGLGVLANCGKGKDAFFQGLLNGPPGNWDVPEFDPLPFYKNPKEARRMDRFAQLALAGAAEALEQAGDFTATPERIGTWIGTGVGGIATLEEQIMVFHEKGPRRVSPFLVPMIMTNAASAAVSMKYGFQGPCENTVTACAASTQSIGRAADLIRLGRCDVMITGGSEASLSPVAMQGFINMTATSKAGISRPFDAERDGFCHSEAAGIVVLEEMEMAKARGANILAEFLGSASTADAHHITAPSPGGVGATRCMEMALEDAGITPGDVTHINAHGTSTPLNDAAEAQAISKVFGSPGPLVTSTKSVTGHALGGAGAIEAVALALCMQHGKIPQTHNYATPDPELATIAIVRDQAADWEPGIAISNSFGFGGHNATLVMGPPPAS